MEIPERRRGLQREPAVTQREVVTGCCTAGAVPRRERSDADRQAVTAADTQQPSLLNTHTQHLLCRLGRLASSGLVFRR